MACFIKLSLLFIIICIGMIGCAQQPAHKAPVKNITHATPTQIPVKPVANVAKKTTAVYNQPKAIKPSIATGPLSALPTGSLNWQWPTTGKLIAKFSTENAKKGIDIGGKNGQAVIAAAPGVVVYAGSGLRGYGQMVIIKHNDQFLSAYAHNSRILVKEGDTVKASAKIAEMGQTDAEGVRLHFEIRKNGQPVDPMLFLPKRVG